MKTNLIIDLSNLVHNKRHSLFKAKEKPHKGAIIHEVINTIKAMSSMFKADGIAIACDSQNVWRRDFYPEYKSNREELRDAHFGVIIEAIEEIKNFFENYTNIAVLHTPRAEADDVIAVFCRYFSGVSKVVVISSDKDFIQLLEPNVRLYSPSLKLERTTTDRGYELFEKCIRGDRGDFIFSAYPRVRSTLLEKAWKDPLEMANLMETITKEGKKVGELFEFNKRLIDLTLQPIEIQDAIHESIDRHVKSSDNKYNYLKAVKYLRDLQLINIVNELESYKEIFKKSITV